MTCTVEAPCGIPSCDQCEGDTATFIGDLLPGAIIQTPDVFGQVCYAVVAAPAFMTTDKHGQPVAELTVTDGYYNFASLSSAVTQVNRPELQTRVAEARGALIAVSEMHAEGIVGFDRVLSARERYARLVQVLTGSRPSAASMTLAELSA